jgi:hypothetical protein
MRRVMVRYKVKADKAAENRQLIEKVFEELQAAAPAGIRYASLVGEDGVSFVHIASIETTDSSNPMGNLKAFQAFQKDIEERCEIQPEVTDLEEVGSFGLLGA